jgi:hypothetical protein
MHPEDLADDVKALLGEITSDAERLLIVRLRHLARTAARASDESHFPPLTPDPDHDGRRNPESR